MMTWFVSFDMSIKIGIPLYSGHLPIMTLFFSLDSVIYTKVSLYFADEIF